MFNSRRKHQQQQKTTHTHTHTHTHTLTHNTIIRTHLHYMKRNNHDDILVKDHTFPRPL